MRDGSPRVLRAMNERAALYALLQSGPLSRIGLERAIGLSKPAAADVLARLERDGLVERAGRSTGGGPGPQAQLWQVNVHTGYAVGVDVTATAMDAAVADLGGTVVGTYRTEWPGGADDDPTVPLRAAVGAALKAGGVPWRDVRHLVVGVPGSVDPTTGQLEYAPHLPGFTGYGVRARVRARLRVPVTVENDVNLVAVDELTRGRATGRRSVLLLWMDRGVASALILDGHLVRGSRGGAGEIDRVPVPGGGLVRDLVSAAAVATLGAAHALPGPDAASVVRQAFHAQSGGEAFRAELADRVTGVLAMTVAAVDPELVVLAGGVGYAGGEALAGLVSDRLGAVLKQRPAVAAGTGGVEAVRHGALQAALRQARESVLGRGAPATPSTVDSPEGTVAE
ncbi:MAG TPA: ROK family transcriptional regulator [Actinocatenispora sp.]